MNHRRARLIVYAGLSLAVLISASFIIASVSKTDNSAERLKIEVTGKLKQDVTKSDAEMKMSETAPAKSGPTNDLPWENDEKFIKIRGENGNLVRMAAYQTVLKDPLPGEEYNVHLAADMLSGTVLKPGEVFSQNSRVGPYTIEKGFQKGPTYVGTQLTTTIGGGVCKIASTLYNVSVLSDLEIVERHAHGMPVPYVPAGQDATVAYGARDFKFKNNTKGPVLIWAKGIDNILYMAFYGVEPPRKVEWHHEVLGSQAAPKTYKINSSLPAGTEKVILEGMDGSTIKSWLTIENPDGSKEVKQMGISSYKPFPYLIEKNQ